MSSVLPAADVSCGVCGTGLRYADEMLACENCLIGYDPMDLLAPARYLDENASACGNPDHPTPWSKRRPFNTVHYVVRTWRTWHYRYSPCALPAGHHRDHHYPETTTHTDEEAADA